VDLYRHILGCLLGTAVGDAVGLKREGLSRQRAMRLYGGPPLRSSLIFGFGFCSDDTEHTLMVGRALASSHSDPDLFERQFVADLRRWLLTGPAGVGFATLRSCLKLLIGFGPRKSGVFSAGNGPAMRSALIGICAKSEGALIRIVRASTRVTHTDPKAEEGALLVARAARLARTEAKLEPLAFLRLAVTEVTGNELRTTLLSAVDALAGGKPCLDFAKSQGWAKGVSGYVNQTVPAALYCWAHSPGDFRQCVENAVLLGGDTDSVAAITGAICGANLGSEAIPADWIERLAEWPRTTDWIRHLAQELTTASENRAVKNPPPMYWMATLPRNTLFAAVVILLGVRRLFPPY
jgi:ADP-ribosyl-[dinitrogen reductase] hydrolase